MFNPNNFEDFDFPHREEGATSSYVIASTPRSGSTLLSRALWSTGLAGAPKEYLHQGHKGDFESRWGALDIPEYMARLAKYRTSPNGQFGMKIHYRQLIEFVIGRGHQLTDLLADPRYIFISRRDRLRQAISLCKANQTNQWLITDGQRPAPASYDYEQTCSCLRTIEMDTSGWRKFFERKHIPFLELEYETIAGDYEESVRTVLDFLGIEQGAVDIPPSQLRVQRDDETEEWVARFKEDRDHGGSAD